MQFFLLYLKFFSRISGIIFFYVKFYYLLKILVERRDNDSVMNLLITILTATFLKEIQG